MMERRWWTNVLGAAAAAILVSASLIVGDRNNCEIDEFPQVVYAGCDRVVLSKPVVCLYAPGNPLRLWVYGVTELSALEVRVDGAFASDVVELPRDDSTPGVGFRLSLPPGAEQIELGKSGVASWTLRVGPHETPIPKGVHTSEDVDRELGVAFSAGLVGDFDQAFTTLTNVESLALAYPEGAADFATYRGQLEWRLGRYYRAAESLRVGVRFARQMEDIELLADSLPMYASSLMELGYHKAAYHWANVALDTLRPRLTCPARVSLFRTVGWINLELEQRGLPYRDPRSLLEASLESECANPTSAAGTLLSLALLELHEGHADAALSWVAMAEGRPATADERLRLRDSELRALVAKASSLPEQSRALERLEHASRGVGTAEAAWRVALRRGQLLVRKGELEAASVAFREAEGHARRVTELGALGSARTWAGLEHQHSTDELVSVLLELGRPSEALSAEREARACRIQALAGTDDLDTDERKQVEEKLRAYRRIQMDQDRVLTRIDEVSRESQRTLQDQVKQLAHELETLGRDILHAKSRACPAVQQLQPRQPRELLVGIYPSAGEWLVFLEDDEELVAHRIDPPSLSERSVTAKPPEALMTLLGDRPARVDRIRVLASGKAQAIDLHLGLWRSRPLLQSVSVVYGAELPWTRPSSTPSRRALLVADPDGTLPWAARGASEIETRLVAGGWTVERLEPTRVGRQALLAELSRGYDLLHFSGHAAHAAPGDAGLWPPYAGGTAAWPAFLRLRRNEQLGIPDILAADAVPQAVVLLGCETGVPDSAFGGPSLATAFLAAGAQMVLATPIPVEDEAAAALERRLYDGRRGGAMLDHALRRAQGSVKGADSFRIWVR